MKRSKRITQALTNSRLARPAMSEAQRFLLLSILIGIFAGLLVVCFHIAIEFLGWYAVGTLAEKTRHATLLSPALGAIVSSLLILWFFQEARGAGVNQAKAAVYVSDGFVPFTTVVGKFLACAISIGSGNSLGPEDPALHMGSGVASLLGRAFQLPRARMRMIAPVGAAAGIAAAFNAPITAVLFVMEEVIAGWHTGVLGSIVLSATSAVVVSRFFLGDQPLFAAPQFTIQDPLELLVHAVIGVAGGGLAAAFTKLVGLLRRRLRELPGWTLYVRPGVAGLLVGLAGLWLPEVMGAGYPAVDAALHSRYSWQLLLALGLVKVLVTLVCFSAGIPGGMFAPTLFAGAMIGGALGSLAQRLALFPTSATGAYVLVGMGTFFAGVFRAPMTSIFMVFEVSATYMIILPVMAANTVAYLVARSLERVPFFELVARDEGLDLPSVEAQREQAPLRVEDAMRAPAPELDPDTGLAAALDAMRREGDGVRLVKTGPGQWSWVGYSELEAAAARRVAGATVRQLGAREPLPRLYPDMPLETALAGLARHPILPVASRADADRLLGAVTMEDAQRALLGRPEGPGS
jgi:CIC family chloride channel protein